MSRNCDRAFSSPSNCPAGDQVCIFNYVYFWWGHGPPAAPCSIYFFVNFELKFRTAGEGEFDNAEQPY